MKRILSIILTLILIISACSLSVDAVEWKCKIIEITLTKDATDQVKKGNYKYTNDTFAYLGVNSIFWYNKNVSANRYIYQLILTSDDEESANRIAEQLRLRDDILKAEVQYSSADTKIAYIILTDEATFQVKMGTIRYTPESFMGIDVKRVEFFDKGTFDGGYIYKLFINKFDTQYKEKLLQRVDVLRLYNITESNAGYIPDVRHISVNVGSSAVVDKSGYSNWVCEDETIVSFENGKITGLKLGYTYIRGTDENGDVFTFKVTVDPVKEHSKTKKTVGKKSATYFAKGYTGDKVCEDCDEVVVKGKQTAKLKLKNPNITIKAGKKNLKIKYKKVKDATGFQVKYKVKGKSYTKTYITRKTATKNIKNLKKGTYKVWVRAFIKQGKNKAYSNFTKVKTIKIK